MRWRAFDRLTAKHNRLVGQSMQAAALKFRLLFATEDFAGSGGSRFNPVSA